MAINTLSDNTEIKNSLNIGSGNTVSGEYAFAQGSDCTASGDCSFVQGRECTASGESSHAEGRYTIANGVASHAEGQSTKARGYASHAEGYYTLTNNWGEHASGSYNNSISGTSQNITALTKDSSATLFSIGNGTSSTARKNVFEVKYNGDIYVKKNDGTTVKLQDLLDRIP